MKKGFLAFLGWIFFCEAVICEAEREEEEETSP